MMEEVQGLGQEEAIMQTLDRKLEWISKNVPVDQLHEHPENNIFRNLGEEDLQDLAQDIREHGIAQPILVRTIGEDAYEILAGHQRTRAVKLLGWTYVTVIVVDVDDDEATHLLISTNLKTRQLSRMELVRALVRERELIEKEFGKRRGRPKGNNSGNDYPNFEGRWAEKVTAKYKIGEKTVRKLEGLKRLILPLQELYDKEILSEAAAAQLAQLSVDEQKQMTDAIGTKIGEIKVADLKRMKKEYELKDKMHEQAKVELEAKRQELTEMQDRVTTLRGEVSILRYEIQSFGNMRQMGEEFRKNLPQYQALHRKSAELEKTIVEQEAEIAKRKEAIAKMEHIVEYVETPVEVPPEDYETLKEELAEKQRQLAAILNEVPQREEQVRAEQTARLLAEQVAAQADRLVETATQMPVPPDVIVSCYERLEMAAQHLHELVAAAQA